MHSQNFAYLCVYATITDSVVPYFLRCNIMSGLTLIYRILQYIQAYNLWAIGIHMSLVFIFMLVKRNESDMNGCFTHNLKLDWFMMMTLNGTGVGFYHMTLYTAQNI